jgi:excisionase family DNA binding protein
MNRAQSRSEDSLPMIIGQSTYYPVELVASILQVPLEIAHFIVDANWEYAEEEDPNTPKGHIREQLLKELQKPYLRFDLDFASMILPFDQGVARRIASDLPWCENYLFEVDDPLKYLAERDRSGIPSLLRSLNSSIPSPPNPDGFLRPRQVAEILGVNLLQVAKLLKVGLLDHEVTSGGHRRFRFEDIKQYKIQQNNRLQNETVEGE